MLIKWLFTFLAIVWLYQALRPFFTINPGQPGATPRKKNKDDDDADYIDYEEIK